MKKKHQKFLIKEKERGVKTVYNLLFQDCDDNDDDDDDDDDDRSRRIH